MHEVPDHAKENAGKDQFKLTDFVAFGFFAHVALHASNILHSGVKFNG